MPAEIQPKTQYSKTFFILALILLLLTVTGSGLVPFHRIDGLDLMNLARFHWLCPEFPIPYEKTGGQCGDPLDRAMLYPPLLYWAFTWVRAFTLNQFDQVLIFWRLAILAFTMGSVGLALRLSGARNLKVLLLLIPFSFSLPMIYALERGNNDALVLMLWMLGIWAFMREKDGIAGAIWAVSSIMKIYPGVGLVLLLLGLFLSGERRRALRLLGSAAVTGLLCIGVLWQDHLHFVFDGLPRALGQGGNSYTSHPLYRKMPGLILRLLGSGVWIYCFTHLFRRREPVLALTAALAISTFYPTLSNDYNLITAFPFLVLLGARAFQAHSTRLEKTLFLFSVFACLVDRRFYALLGSSMGNAAVFVLWFFLTPVGLTKIIPRPVISMADQTERTTV